MVNLINIFVKNKNLSYSNLGKARSYSYDGLGNRMGKKSSHIYRMSLEVQFDFLSREEKVKLYTVMMNLEKIPIAHRDICSHSGIQAIDMIM